MSGSLRRSLMHGIATVALMVVAVDVSAQTSVNVSVSAREVVVNEGFSITVTVRGNLVSLPEFPNADGLRIDRDTPRTSHSTSMSIINGRTSVVSERSWTYTAWPLRGGKLTVPRIKVEVDGKPYLTQQVVVTARERRRPRAPRTPGAGANTRGTSTEPGTNTAPVQPTLEDAFFIESTTDKSSSYQGEPIKLVLSIWELTGYGIRGAALRGNLPLPTTEGFYNGPIVEGSRRDTRDTFAYGVKQFQMFVYPTATGRQTIGSWEWDGYVHYRSSNSMFGSSRTRKRYRTEPIKIDVKPLPPQPEEFSGAVGEFTVTGMLHDSDALQGIPLRYVVAVVGEGNPDAIGALRMPDLPWAYVSEAESRVPEVDPSDSAPILKEFTYRIVPQEIGEQLIPALQFIYFSPSAEAYRVEKIPETSLYVKGSGEGETLVAIGGTESIAQRTVQILSEDVLPIITAAGRLGPRRSSVPTVGLVTVLPPMFYAALFLYCRRTRRLVEDTKYARNHLARSKGEKRLQGMEHSEDPMSLLYGALVGFLADKFNINGAGLTSSDAGDALRERRIDGELSSKFVKILGTCERTRYAGTRLSTDEVQALKHGAIAAMDQLEALLRKGKRG